MLIMGEYTLITKMADVAKKSYQTYKLSLKTNPEGMELYLYKVYAGIMAGVTSFPDISLFNFNFTFQHFFHQLDYYRFLSDYYRFYKNEEAVKKNLLNGLSLSRYAKYSLYEAIFLKQLSISANSGAGKPIYNLENKYYKEFKELVSSKGFDSALF